MNFQIDFLFLRELMLRTMVKISCVDLQEVLRTSAPDRTSLSTKRGGKDATKAANFLYFLS
jgi:hypothetical protein